MFEAYTVLRPKVSSGDDGDWLNLTSGTATSVMTIDDAEVSKQADRGGFWLRCMGASVIVYDTFISSVLQSAVSTYVGVHSLLVHVYSAGATPLLRKRSV